MKLESIIEDTEKKQRESAVKSVLKSIINQSEMEEVKQKPKEIVERFGKITSVENNTIWVDFDGNPIKSEVMAEFECPDITLNEVEELKDLIDVVKLEFKDSALKKPVIRDIYLSVSVIKLFKYL